MYLGHHNLAGVPGAFLGYLVGWGGESHHSSRDVHHGKGRLAEGLELRQVGLVEGVEGRVSSLRGEEERRRDSFTCASASSLSHENSRVFRSAGLE